MAPDMAFITTCDPSSQVRCVVTLAPRELRFSMEAKSARRGSRTRKICTINRVAVRGCFRPSNIQPRLAGRRYLRVKTTSLGRGQSSSIRYKPECSSGAVQRGLRSDSGGLSATRRDSFDGDTVAGHINCTDDFHSLVYKLISRRLVVKSSSHFF